MSLSSSRKILTSFRTRLSKDYYLYKQFQLLRATISAKTLTTTMTTHKDTNNLVESIPKDVDNENGDTQKSVYVQHSQVSDMMTISFEYSHNGKIKSFNLWRKASEPLSASLQRLKLNLAKYSQNKKIKKDKLEGDTSEPVSQVELYLNNAPIDAEEAKNVDAWVEGAVMKLNGEPYVIKRNEPQVTIMRLPSIIMRGFITVPSLELYNCNIHDCEFEWYRKISSREHTEICSDPNQVDKIQLDNRDKSYWLHLATGITYSPTDEDVAHHLKVVCRPINGTRRGPIYSCPSLRQVELGPPTCPFVKRHTHTPEPLPAGDKIRFVSYNILADLYADQEYSRSVLFAHCPTHALDIDYRRQLLLKEIHGYNADIVCLQEVDRKEFNKTYEPYFKLVGQHTGVYNRKGQVGEGVATFFRDDRFELIESHVTSLWKLIDPSDKREASEEVDEAIPASTTTTTDISEPKESEDSAVKADIHPILDDLSSNQAKKLLASLDKIRSRIQCNPALQKRFMGRHTVLQTTLLKFKDKPDTFVIVANTHLYFAPDADHVRLLQGSVSVKYLEFIKDYYKKLVQLEKKIDKPHMSIIFCGDMNSSPDCGLYKLVQEGYVGEDLNDWKSNEEQAVTGLSVETNLRFSSSYKDIPYTNYTPGFNGCLDYIYYEVENFDCESTVPLPDHEDVIETGGIPSDVFPSDHLALVANLRFKS